MCEEADQTKTGDVLSQIGKYTNFQIYNSTNQISSDDHLEKKCGKKAIRCFIPDKGQGRRMDKNKTDRPLTGLRKEAKWQRRGG